MTSTTTPPELRSYRLADNLEATSGQVFLTGTQALIRLPLMQAARDAARGIASRGFVSGYRGSPLGMVDQQAWKAQKLLDAAGVNFLPAINEELAATAVLGTQRVESDPERTADGVYAMWYGKGPGVDRAGDALKHGNAYGSSPHGGVLAVAGDDHGCVSSSMPHRATVPSSPGTCRSSRRPTLPSTSSSASTAGNCRASPATGSASPRFPKSSRAARPWTSTRPRARRHLAGGLRSRSPDRVPSTRRRTALSLARPAVAEDRGARASEKLDAVRAFARINSIDREIVAAPQATVGIVTCGKAHYDLLEVFRRLDIPLDALAAAGVRLYKVGLSFPLEPTRATAFAAGLEEILVVEEKAGVVEAQLASLFYNAAPRPLISASATRR